MTDTGDLKFYLLCDECGHEEFYEGRMTRDHIGTPCPKCDADMLTEDDFALGMQVQVAMEFLQMAGIAETIGPHDKADPEKKLLRFGAHKGVITIDQNEALKDESAREDGFK